MFGRELGLRLWDMNLADEVGDAVLVRGVRWVVVQDLKVEGFGGVG